MTATKRPISLVTLLRAPAIEDKPKVFRALVGVPIVRIKMEKASRIEAGEFGC
jgi:hypothetical protein